MLYKRGRGGGGGGGVAWRMRERLEALLFSQRPFNSLPLPLRHAARSTARRLEACVTSQRERKKIKAKGTPEIVRETCCLIKWK